MSRKPTFRVVLILAMLMLSQTSAAQQPDTLIVGLVEQRIAALKDAGVADDNEVLATYQQTGTLLNRADAQLRDETTYLELISSEPQREAEIRARIDESDDSFDPTQELADLTPEELAARLTLAKTEQRDLGSRLETLDRQLAARETNAAAIRARLSEITQQLGALPGGALTLDPTAPPSQAEAEQWRDAAEVLALRAERQASEAQLSSQPVRYSAMGAERAELALKQDRLSILIKALESQVSRHEQERVDSIEIDLAETDPAYSVAQALVKTNEEIAVERARIAERLAEIGDQNNEITRRSKALEDRYATARRIVDFAGDSKALGRVLLTYWDEISDFTVRDPTRNLSQALGSAVINRIAHETALSKVASATGYVNQLLADADLNPESISPASRAALMALTSSYRDQLRTVITAESNYITALSTLDTGYSALEVQIDEYKGFIEGVILWIPNHPPIWNLTPTTILSELDYMAATLNSISLTPGLGLALALLAALVLLRYRPRLVELQTAMNGRISRPRDDSIRFTIIALGTAALRAAPYPIVFLGVVSVFDPTASTASLYMRDLFLITATLVFSFSLMRILCEPSGIGRVHFNWASNTMQRVHLELTFLLHWWLPIMVATSCANRLTPSTGDEASGRILMLLALLLIFYHFGSHVVRELRTTGRAWFRPTLNRLRVLLVLAFLAGLIAVAWGQVFTVIVVGVSFINTLWLGITLLLVHALLTRWLLVARRHLRLNELFVQRTTEQTSEDGGSVEEYVPDLGDISEETRQLVTAATMVTGAVALLYLWAPLLPALDALSRVDLWTSTSEVDGEAIVNQITLATLLTVTVLAGFTLYVAQKLPAVVEIILRSQTGVSPGARYTASTLLNYLIIGAGIIAALSALGLRWGQLQWLVAALGVGIGFGLQEIVANFISGLIILFERPIRVGDIVTIGDKDGTVTKVRIRATTIRDWDGKELLVPNKEFITGRLLNWTLSDSQTRVTIAVGIAYGSNVEQALKILTEVVLAHPRTLAEPAPLIVFENFGDNALELSSRSFIDALEGRLQVMTELRTEINRRFAEAGIVIAFPQRDVHLDSAAPIRIVMDPATQS